MKRIYLAGPEVFLPEPIEEFEGIKSHASRVGFEAFSPFDSEIKPENLAGLDLARHIYRENIKLIEKCDFILCTGLFDEHEDDLNYYKKFLEDQVSKKLVCTNPDLTVHRGNVEELCAGSVAKVFEELGGKVEYFGKPYPKVYNQAAKTKNKKVFCIGDNLNTDIKGANNQNFASLLITNGIHRQEVENENFEKIMKKYNTKVDYIQSKLKW